MKASPRDRIAQDNMHTLNCFIKSAKVFQAEIVAPRKCVIYSDLCYEWTKIWFWIYEWNITLWSSPNVFRLEVSARVEVVWRKSQITKTFVKLTVNFETNSESKPCKLCKTAVHNLQPFCFRDVFCSCWLFDMSQYFRRFLENASMLRRNILFPSLRITITDIIVVVDTIIIRCSFLYFSFYANLFFFCVCLFRVHKSFHRVLIICKWLCQRQATEFERIARNVITAVWIWILANNFWAQHISKVIIFFVEDRVGDGKKKRTVLSCWIVSCDCDFNCDCMRVSVWMCVIFLPFTRQFVLWCIWRWISW